MDTQQQHRLPAWRWVGDRGLLLATGDATLACYARLTSLAFDEVEDVVPAEGSLLLVLRQGVPLSTALCEALAAPMAEDQAASGKLHDIPVAYGGEAGPDLAEMAVLAGLSEDAYIAQHAAGEYTVAFLGFQPGFPYLRGLPPALHAPRRSRPRVRVDAGSVAVGGTYVGIYPANGPGGWNIVGRSPVALFDPLQEAPALLLPGDRVRFVPT